MTSHRPITKISASFANLSDAKLYYKASHICQSISGSDYYSRPTPDIKYLKDGLLKFEQTLKVAHIKTRINVFHKNEARKNLIGLLKELGHYVNHTAKGNLAMLTASGFDIAKDEDPLHEKIPAEVFQKISETLSSEKLVTVTQLSLPVIAGLTLLHH